MGDSKAQELKKEVEERKSIKDSEVEWLDSEVEEGNVEYKLKIKDPNSVRFQQLVTQMKFRLSEGSGVCYYCVGVADDGYPRGLAAEELQQSVDGVFQMAELLHANAEIKWRFTGAYGRDCIVIKVVRLLYDRLPNAGVRIGVIGAVGVGKSTLIASLINGNEGEPMLDDGQGSARTSILRHKHEIETGHTSTVTKHFLGYSQNGQVLNYSGLSTMTSAEIGLAASHRVNLIDVGGHEKFLKTVFRGLTAMAPDYVFVCVSSATGLTEITHQQIAVAIGLNIPCIIIMMKKDISTKEQSEQTLRQIVQLYRSIYPDFGEVQTHVCRLRHSGRYMFKGERRILKIQNQTDVEAVVQQLAKMQSTEGVIPVLDVSSVTGQGLSTLHCLLSSLESRVHISTSSSEETRSRFQIDEVIELTHAGSILSGTLISGTLGIGEQQQLGPDCRGDFQLVKIRSIRCNQVPVKEILAGQTATIGVSLVNGASFKTERVDDEEEVASDRAEFDGDSVIRAIRRDLREARLNCGAATRLENARDLEGTVLLDEAVRARTYQCIEAVLVMKGGQWPPRGLITGKWPPQQRQASESDSQSGRCVTTARRRSCSPLRLKKHTPESFPIGIYCEGVRQAAYITAIEELTENDLQRIDVPSSIRAAAEVGTTADVPSPCFAKLKCHFQLKPEWLRLGSIIIVRDQTLGHLSGIGVITDFK